MVDARGYDLETKYRNLQTGEPAHDMWVRLTIDEHLTIVAAESSTDASPYPTCPEVTPHTQRLVGLKIIGGFKREMHARIGNTEGCTHIVTLVEALAAVAVQTSAGQRRTLGMTDHLAVFGPRDAKRPGLVDSCHSYAADSPITAELWPMHYRPRK